MFGMTNNQAQPNKAKNLHFLDKRFFIDSFNSQQFAKRNGNKLNVYKYYWYSFEND